MQIKKWLFLEILRDLQRFLKNKRNYGEIPNDNFDSKIF